ncbi:hypothetical protein ACLBXJ_22425 [Methylobacterium mesophilicum]
MAKIGFFGDDDAAGLCARMVSIGLAPLNDDTVLALPRGEGEAEDRRPGAETEPGRVTVVRLDRYPDAREVGDICALADRSGIDLVAALPLDELRNGTLRNQFDAVITVGAGHVAGARALRAARYEVLATPPATGQTAVPAWFLAGSDQSILTTKARMSSVNGPRLPFATRSLPMLLPRLNRHGLCGPVPWGADEPAMATATLLAALVLVVAADPTAARIEAADVAAMMAAGTASWDRRLAVRLRALARSYARTAGGNVDGPIGCRATRPSDRRPQPALSAPVANEGVRSPAARALRSFR